MTEKLEKVIYASAIIASFVGAVLLSIGAVIEIYSDHGWIFAIAFGCLVFTLFEMVFYYVYVIFFKRGK